MKLLNYMLFHNVNVGAGKGKKQSFENFLGHHSKMYSENECSSF